MFREVNPEMHFVVGSPLVGWKCEKGEGVSWLRDAEEIKSQFPNVKFFAALELDSKGLEPFSEVIEILNRVEGQYWTYTVNDNETTVTSSNRWIRIETGRNLIREFTQRWRPLAGHAPNPLYHGEGKEAMDAVLYVDSDMILEARHISAMMEVDHPMVGVNVPAYCLVGEVVNESPRIEERWNTAGALWVNSPAYYDMLWHHNSLIGHSDDPATQLLMERLRQPDSDQFWGQTWVRTDIDMVHDMKLLVEVEKRNIPDRDT